MQYFIIMHVTSMWEKKTFQTYLGNLKNEGKGFKEQEWRLSNNRFRIRDQTRDSPTNRWNTHT